MHPPLPEAAAFPRVRACADETATLVLGTALAGRLRGGEHILLWGELGAGKTRLVQGICRGLDCRDPATSPTFNLAHRYEGRLVVHHLDCYRLTAQDDLHDIGLDAVLDEVAAGGAVLLAEWPAPLLSWLCDPVELLLLVTGPSRRRILLRGGGAAGRRLAGLFTPREP